MEIISKVKKSFLTRDSCINRANLILLGRGRTKSTKRWAIGPPEIYMTKYFFKPTYGSRMNQVWMLLGNLFEFNHHFLELLLSCFLFYIFSIENKYVDDLLICVVESECTIHAHLPHSKINCMLKFRAYYKQLLQWVHIGVNSLNVLLVKLIFQHCPLVVFWLHPTIYFSGKNPYEKNLARKKTFMVDLVDRH